MSFLNNDHFDYITKDLQYRGVVLENFQDEVVDHVCSAVEKEMESGKRFIDAYSSVLKSFGYTDGLLKTQSQTLKSDISTRRLMVKNYLKIALRNLSRHKFYTMINISGLALGIASCLLIILYVSYELSYDRYHAKADRIYRVNGEIKFGGTHYRLAVAPAPLGDAIVDEYPEVESFVRFRNRGTSLVKTEGGTESFRENRLVWVDSTFFKFFSVNVLSGDPETALQEPNSIAISESAAKKYFNGNALGKSLIIDNETNAKVTAVFEDMRPNSHFRMEFLVAMSGLEDAQSSNFLSNNYNTYLLFRPGADIAAFHKKLQEVVLKYVGPQAAEILGGEFTMEKFLEAGNKIEYTLMPLTDIHLRSDLTAELGANSDIIYVYLFAAIAIFILMIACVNFMNLSTARSSNRAKEVGIRKVMGSLRSHLVRQFLMESILLSLFAFILAIALAYVSLPYFNSVSQLDLTLPSNFSFYAILLMAALFVGGLAGVYPSFFLSAFEPVKVLKGQLALGSKSGVIRGALVIFQFVISIFLIIGTFTVNSQLNFIQNKKVGFNKDQVIMISDLYALGDKAESYKNEVLENTFIKNGTISGFIPVWGGWRTDNTFWPEGSQPTEDKLVGMQNWSVDYDYINTMGMTIVKGRNFSREFPSDSSAVILNQTALKHFHIESDPIGKKISTFADENADGTINRDAVVSYEVIGVVEDFHFESLKQNITPLGIILGRSPGYASFRFEAKNTSEVISSLEKTWKKLASGQPFQYQFLDESFARMYASEERLGKIFGGFAGLAIVIASLGLFALSAFTAEQRNKEIGIRKVLGASVPSIVILLSREFGKLILIAFLLAAPIAWYAVNWWLKNYTYKVEIGIWVYVLAGFSAFMIAWLTMSYQSIKAATANPVTSLRSE
jgi:putative ABC transport system permease protein